jgi:hypothetical protein
LGGGTKNVTDQDRADLLEMIVLLKNYTHGATYPNPHSENAREEGAPQDDFQVSFFPEGDFFIPKDLQ